jgi:tetratricopeptide (TPR) repeat protein
MKNLGVSCLVLLVLICSSVSAQEMAWRKHMEAGIAASTQLEYDTAVVEFSAALEIAEKYYQDSTWLGDTYAHLAGAYRSKDYYIEASKNYLSALESTERILGRGHIYTAQYLTHLGNTYIDMGNLQAGIEMNERALKIIENHPANDLELANMRTSMGNAYNMNEQYPEAIAKLELALPLLEAELGRIHPEVSKVYHSIGQTQIKLHNYEQAEIAHKECLSRRVEYFGARHEEVGWTHNNLSQVYHDWGRYIEAEKEILLAIEIFEETIGPESQNMGTALNNYAALRDSEGRYEESAELYKRSLDINIKAYGPEHPRTLITQDGYDKVRDRLKRR